MLFLESLDRNGGLILTDYGKGMVIIMKKWKKSLENRKIGLTIFAAAIIVVGIVIVAVKFNQAESNRTMKSGESEVTASVEEKQETVEKEETGETSEIKIDPAYKLVWEDNFDGTELNRDDWNVELHAPGWVNAEWQEYVDCEDNIYVKDGNLIIQPIKTKAGSKDYYTSGRINTQNKHDFKYGRFEMRGKVPSGQGFLPAFWMMPTDESFYGQWPKCGEIDIMEVMGQSTDTLYGTLHFGEPHAQKQGTYVLDEGNFADEYHVFACEWEPGEMRFYVDDKLYYTEHDWFTKRNGFDEITYPAPYDQPFYMILNVAVGGSWVGYPDASTEYNENAQMVVDYVRVYQKDEYDENVTKMVKEVVVKEADETGNFVTNSMFDTNESLEDDKDWKFLLFGGGEAEASISDSAIHIVTTDSGSLEYSVQLVQPNIPMEKGYKYRLSFEAYADKERSIITTVSAPDLNFARYLEDEKLKLTTEPQTYEYEFDMLEEDDANGRIEFNMGAQGSSATVHITNVRVEKIGEIENFDIIKSVLPDGNHIFNSTFDRGDNRLGYWEILNNCEGAVTYVTNQDLNREFKAEIPASVTSLEDVILKQAPLLVEGGKVYKLSLSAYAEEEKTIAVRIADQVFDLPITQKKDTYYLEIKTDSSLKETSLDILLGVAGTTYIDDVRLYECGMVANGNFTNGTVGYEIYIDETAQASYAVDELSEGGALGFDISDTADEAWKINLKQRNIRLEKGKWYQISFDAKTSLNRDVEIELRKDSLSDSERTSYSGAQVFGISKGYLTFSHTFKMEEETDENAVLCIELGNVSDSPIKKQHTVYIDNITLEEVEAP